MARGKRKPRQRKEDTKVLLRLLPHNTTWDDVKAAILAKVGCAEGEFALVQFCAGRIRKTKEEVKSRAYVNLVNANGAAWPPERVESFVRTMHGHGPAREGDLALSAA